MDFISVFFTFLSLITLLYILYILKKLKRLPLIYEIFFLGVYIIILLLFLFPNILDLIQNTFGINSAINFIIYLSIFILYFIVFILYKKTEDQRVEITKLVREIAYINVSKRKK